VDFGGSIEEALQRTNAPAGGVDGRCLDHSVVASHYCHDGGGICSYARRRGRQWFHRAGWDGSTRLERTRRSLAPVNRIGSSACPASLTGAANSRHALVGGVGLHGSLPSARYGWRHWSWRGRVRCELAAPTCACSRTGGSGTRSSMPRCRYRRWWGRLKYCSGCARSIELRRGE
jgi:hypothetical protein